MVTVFIPSPFRKFSDGRDRVDVEGVNLRQLLDNLDKVCPGIKEQIVVDGDIRPGIAIAINDSFTGEGLLEAVPADSTVHILPAIGGG